MEIEELPSYIRKRWESAEAIHDGGRFVSTLLPFGRGGKSSEVLTKDAFIEQSVKQIERNSKGYYLAWEVARLVAESLAWPEKDEQSLLLEISDAIKNREFAVQENIPGNSSLLKSWESYQCNSHYLRAEAVNDWLLNKGLKFRLPDGESGHLYRPAGAPIEGRTLKGAMDSNEIRQRLLLIARDRLRYRPGAYGQFQYAMENTVQGTALTVHALSMPYAWQVSEQMGDTRAMERIREHLTRIVDKWAQSQPLPPAVEPLPGAELPQVDPTMADTRDTAAPVAESADQRQARRWKLCVDAGLPMPQDTYAQFPRGIRKVADSEGITRQALAQDLNAHRERIFGK